MAYFPFYIDIENKKILVVGGGTVALRKIEKLMPFSPDITVVPYLPTVRECCLFSFAPSAVDPLA